MISFSEYVQMNMNKAYNRTPVSVHEEPVKVQNVEIVPMKEKSPLDYLKESKPETWTAKIVENKKYLFFNNHYLNITNLKKNINEIYNQNGYANYGFSKLDESELIRYNTIRDILSKEFNNSIANNELDAKNIAQVIFDKDMKDFEWHPQPLKILR